ncbi:MAG: hypothetical protein VB857_16415, partial [Pirellulaceae bacterium]
MALRRYHTCHTMLVEQKRADLDKSLPHSAPSGHACIDGSQVEGAVKLASTGTDRGFGFLTDGHDAAGRRPAGNEVV